ncbi:MAG: site-specific DNA-methyltransferase [archaeon]|nr:site-specific DNA-methyltransferase [archaeon]
MSEVNNKFDLILSDPPYGTTKCKWDSVINLPLMWYQLKRLIKKNRAIILMAQTPFDKVLGYSNLEMLRYEWIWEKPSATGFLNAKKMPMKAHENILVFYECLPDYFPIKTHGHKKKTATKGAVNSECYGKAVKTVSYNSTERYPRSVLKISSDKQKTGKMHPTQKPLELMEYFIKTYTKENETVLDFCSGSSTTAIACENLNRKWMMIEKEEKYCEISAKRIEQETKQLKLF